MTIMITGGGSGIGAATARRIGLHARILVTDRNGDAAQAVARAIVESGGRAFARELDVTDEGAIAAVVTEEGAKDAIVGLFCNAGINLRHRAEDIVTADWRRMMDVHVRGSFLCARAVAPAMRAARRGVILNMSSDYAVLGMPVSPAYAAAKTAVYSLTKCLALEFAPFGVRVNALGPGPIDTPLLRSGRTGDEWASAERRLLDGIPIGRLGQPEEVAALADFLLSDRASYITGQIVHPNGGQLTW